MNSRLYQNGLVWVDHSVLCLFIALFLQVIVYYTGANYPMQAFIAMVLPFLILLSFIRSLKILGPFSLAANILLSSCLIVIFVYLFSNLQPVSSVPYFAGWSRLPLFFGTAIYAFEGGWIRPLTRTVRYFNYASCAGIGIILPIENRMKSPQDFSGWCGILNLGMVMITVLYTSAGFYGYLTFGEDIKDSITLNLPHRGWAATFPRFDCLVLDGIRQTGFFCKKMRYRSFLLRWHLDG